MKKRIDFYCSLFLAGGIETTLLQLLSKIDKEKFIIRLIILFKTPGQENLLNRVPQGVEVKYIVGSHILNYFRAERLLKKLPIGYKIVEELFFVNFRRFILRKTLKKCIAEADVVVDYGMALMKYTNFLSGSKSVIYCHFSLNHLNRNNAQKNLKLVHTLNHYSKVITICNEMKDQFLQHFPNANDKVISIYNFIDVDQIRSFANSVPQVKDEIGNYIIAVGRLDQSQKDYVTLLKAFALCKNEYGIDEKLVILGKGRDANMLVELCRQLGISNDVLFKGFEINPFRWIKDSRLLVHSSKFEGLPTVLIEAHALEIPIIATKCETGVAELLEDGKAGLLVPVGDFNTMASEMARLLNDRKLISSCVVGAKSVLERFTHSNTIRKLEELLLEV